MRPLAIAVLFLYAALLVAGGVMGWRLSGSRISFTTGLASAALLSIAYRLSHNSAFSGYLMTLVVSVMLTTFFGWRFGKTRKFFPSGMMLLLSGIVAGVFGWFAAGSW